MVTNCIMLSQVSDIIVAICAIIWCAMWWCWGGGGGGGGSHDLMTMLCSLFY